MSREKQEALFLLRTFLFCFILSCLMFYISESWAAFWWFNIFTVMHLMFAFAWWSVGSQND